MSTFDSPIARCDVIQEMVLTDMTQAECSAEHACHLAGKCPLCGYFTETGEVTEKAPDPAGAAPDDDVG